MAENQWVTEGITPMSGIIILLTLRIQVCPKEGITPTFLFFSDGIGTLNPIRSGGVWILRVITGRDPSCRDGHSSPTFFCPHVLTSNKRPKSYWFEVREKGRHVLTLGLLAFVPKNKKVLLGS